MFFMLLKHMSNFVSIRCYLLYDPWTYFLCIILDNKNLQFKQLIDNITIDLSFWKFCKYGRYKKKCYPLVDLSKFTSNKIILSEVVILDYNQVYSQTLSFHTPSQRKKTDIHHHHEIQ